MDAEEPVEVYSVTDPTMAELIRNALEEEGIQCEISGEGQAGLSGVLEIQIMTRAIDADRARKICRDLEQHHGKRASGEEG
jgi:DNA-binding response OmpR family regulator